MSRKKLTINGLSSMRKYQEVEHTRTVDFWQVSTAVQRNAGAHKFTSNLRPEAMRKISN